MSSENTSYMNPIYSSVNTTASAYMTLRDSRRLSQVLKKCKELYKENRGLREENASRQSTLGGGFTEIPRSYPPDNFMRWGSGVTIGVEMLIFVGQAYTTVNRSDGVQNHFDIWGAIIQTGLSAIQVSLHFIPHSPFKKLDACYKSIKEENQELKLRQSFLEGRFEQRDLDQNDYKAVTVSPTSDAGTDEIERSPLIEQREPTRRKEEFIIEVNHDNEGNERDPSDNTFYDNRSISQNIPSSTESSDDEDDAATPLMVSKSSRTRNSIFQPHRSDDSREDDDARQKGALDVHEQSTPAKTK